MTSFRQQLFQENVEKSGKLEEWQLQFLVDEVARLLGEKAKYEAKFNARLKSYDARAHTTKFVKTGRRMIEFNEYKANDSWLWFRHSYQLKRNADGTASNEMDIEATRKMRREGLIKTIMHEIAHFKRVQKERRQWNHNKPVEWTRRHHVKSFYHLVEKLRKQVEPHLPYLISLDLSQAPKPQPKPKPNKQDVLGKKLAYAEKKIKQTQTRIKRLQTSLKKWQRKQHYYKKQVVALKEPQFFDIS